MKCEDCKVNEVPAYRKKYCDDCANRRKAEYEAKESNGPVNATIVKIPVETGYTEGISTVTHVFQSSYEFGPAGNRHIVKYNTIEELKVKVNELREAGFVE